MEFLKFIESGSYLDEFKKEKVVYRKYPKKNLMIIKRNYNSKFSETKPWLNYCRGLVIDYKLHKVVFIPPVKSKELLTYQEYVNETGESSKLLVDGTMINLYWYNEWNLSTRSNIGCTNKWDSTTTFKQLFDECSVNLDLSTLNKEYTYSFVMRHTNNKIIMPVEKNELILVEVYHNQVRLDSLPPNTGYTCVQDSLIVKDKFVKGYTQMVDGIRYKWIISEYKYAQSLVPNTNNDLLNYLVLRKNNNLTNYLTYFPEKRYTYQKYREKLYKLTQIIYEYYKNIFIYKLYEKNEIPFKLRPTLYDIHKIYLKNKEAISFAIMKEYMYKLEPKRIAYMFSVLK